MLAPASLKAVHPLGKSPVIEVKGPNQAKSIVIAESGTIVEYLSEHFGRHLIPKRYPEGKDGEIGGETESWLRYAQLMQYAEGSLMSMLVLALVVGSKFFSICIANRLSSYIRCSPGESVLSIGNAYIPSIVIKDGPQTPFFIKPLTREIGKRVEAAFITRNLESSFSYIEGLISSSPDNGQFLCGPELTGADILMVYPLEAAMGRAGLDKEKYPKTCAYVGRLQQRDAYKKAVQRIIDETGEYNPSLT